jgi:phenylacetate-CoA ligase
MRLLLGLKNIAEQLPYGVGRHFAGVSYARRLGSVYSATQQDLQNLQTGWAPAYTYERRRRLLEHAINNTVFYREFYKTRGFAIEDFQCLDDWQKVPVVTKADFQKYSLSDRCTQETGFLVNTGGTSGEPLDFKVDRDAYAREWAHMHDVWGEGGYDLGESKVTFRGKHFHPNQLLKYNAVHHEFVVNASAPMEKVAKAICALSLTEPVRWVHGYPSLVAEFAHMLDQAGSAEADTFRSNLRGVLLGSEFPASVYRDIIREALSDNIIVWYGHSEMALLAKETSENLYQSYPTYGLAESVPLSGGDGARLISTSFHNLTHPFIRYDTGDVIEPVQQHGAALVFKIKEGRVGDFILDKTGQRHSLTAIIFGRHHHGFNYLRHLQVRDDGGGSIALIVCPRTGFTATDITLDKFSLSDLPIDWTIELRDEPVRSRQGKIALKVHA